jgi:hypothetical protein
MQSLTSSSIYHKYIMTSINQQSIINIHRNIVDQNLRGNPNGRKPHNDFIIYQNNTFIGSTNFQILQVELEGGHGPLFIGSNLKEARTPLIIWIQPEGGYNVMILILQLEGISNSLCSLVPTGRRI